MTEIPNEFPLPEEAAQRQRSLLGAHIEAGRRSARTTRRGVVAVASVILVGGLLVTPALGIGSRLLELIQSPPGRPDVQTPVWSPDGRRIAFLSRRDGNKELYVMNADGSGQRRLTRDASISATPAWSPDGRTLAFESVRDGTTGVYVVNADGGGQRRLARNGHAPAWSPDGRTIAFFSGPKIYLMNADGSEHRRLTKPVVGGRQRSLAWSPDGRKLAFLSQSGCGDFCFSLYVVGSDGSGLRNLTSKLAASVVLAAVPHPILPGRPTGGSSHSCDSTPASGIGSDLRRERRRQRAAEPDAEAGGDLRRSCLVARRAEARLRQ